MNLLLVDDEMLIREGLAYLLSTFNGIKIVGQASNGEEAISICAAYPVDLVLMDIRMPVMDGCQATGEIKKKWPHIKVLILTTFKDDDYISKAMTFGASGYLLKTSSPDLIYSSLLTAQSGGIVIDSNMPLEALKSKVISSKPTDYDLTERECVIMKLMADGYSNKEIGDIIFLTEGSVKNCITQLLAKLELKDRTQIVSFAFRKGLVK